MAINYFTQRTLTLNNNQKLPKHAKKTKYKTKIIQNKLISN